MGRFTTSLALTPRHQLLAGFSVKQAQLNNSTTFADTVYNSYGQATPREALSLPPTLSTGRNSHKYAGFAEIKNDLTRRLELTLGLRWDYYDFIDQPSYPALRGSANLKATDRLGFKASLGRYYQSPSYVWTLNPANSNLKALRSDMAVAGAYYLLSDAVQLSGEIYGKQYANLPAGTTPETSYLVLTNSGVGFGGREDNFQSFGFLPLQSTANGRAYGLEITVQKKYTLDCCYGQASLSLGRSEYEAPNGKTYPGQYDQAVIFNVSGGFKPDPRWDFGGKFRYWTGSPFTPVYRPADNGGELENIPDEYLSKRLESGHHLDLRVDRRFNLTNWAMVVFVDVQNVYNKKIQLRPRYDFVNDKVEDRNSIGILPSIGFRAEF